MFKNKIKLLLKVVIIFSIFFVSRNISLAKNSSDAISVRVIPNPKHYSAQRWYQEQSFIGTPQQLLIDGYEAIRNGNTVYVNAANISTTFPQTLFTNIYIISYNIKADKETEDIFARILENWKFNRNINITTGFCSPSFSSQLCILNSDCPNNSYCSSDKAETIRDTARLASIAEINIALDDYMRNNGYYPILSGGTYLPNKTVSTWPSWQGTFSKELKIQLPVDPVNNLGNCSGYDNVTCWNEVTKEFADPIINTNLDLPTGSKAFVYQSSPTGDSFDICSEMESGFVFGAGSGACAMGIANTAIIDPSSPVVPGPTPVNIINSTNYPPQIIASNIPTAFAGHSYTAYIQGVDPNNDVITWSLDTSMTAWTNWSGAPSITFTAVNNQIMVEALTVGDVGVYNFSITLSDSSGAITIQNFSINVQNFPPIINSTPFYHIATSTLSFLGGFTVLGDSINYPLSYSLDQALPNNFTTSFTQNGTYWDFIVSGIIVPAPMINILNHGTTPFVRTLTITDTYGTSNSEQLVLNIINHKPVIQPLPVCQDRVRSLPAIFIPPPSVVSPTIVSLSASPNPWTVNNIDTGGTVSVNITVNTTNADTCSWCGDPVNCNGTTLVTTSAYETGSVVSCLLRARDSGTGLEVSQRGYARYSCTGLHQSQGIYMGWGGGGCNTGADTSLCVITGVCSQSYAQDGPYCVADSGSPTGYYIQECNATCSEPGGWCDATNWTSSCSGTWSSDIGYRNPVGCCSDANCMGTHTCISDVCIYPAEVLGVALDCADTSTASNWFKTYGDRCGEPSGLGFWNTQIGLGSTTVDFILFYDNNCITLSGTTTRSICNSDLLCGGGEYILNTLDCQE